MIEINHLNFGYRKKEPLFSDLSFTANPNNIVGLLGKNGAGKSTLLKLIAGLLEAPGKAVNVSGYIPYERKPDFLRDVYFVAEDFDLPAVSIKTYVRANSVFYPRFDNERLTRVLSDFELSPDANLSKISYGQMKKFIIAFALATNCRLLVFDEPTNGLDIPSKGAFRKVMAGALNDDQIAVISTHQVKDVENLIDQLVIIDQGKIVFDQTMYDVSKKFAFSTVTSFDESQVLYHEVVPGGFKVLKPVNGHRTEVDMELLFNAVIKGANV
jgi:ABC-2 type transport system ATP-binding protein